MTNFMFHDFFLLTSGERVATNRTLPSGGNSVSWHHVYRTTVRYTNLGARNSRLRLWSPASAPLFPDGTIVLGLVKVHAPNAPDLISLDAMSAYPVNGDPSSDQYQDSIPDIPGTLCFVIGTVRSGQEILSDGSRTFTLATMAYVFGANQPSLIRCRFEATPRWAHTACPSPNSVVLVVGNAEGTAPDGLLSFTIADLTFNPTAITGPSPPAGGPGPGGAGVKKRKFRAFVGNDSEGPTSGATSSQAVLSQSGVNSSVPASRQATAGAVVPVPSNQGGSGNGNMQIQPQPSVPIPSAPNPSNFGTFVYPDMMQMSPAMPPSGGQLMRPQGMMDVTLPMYDSNQPGASGASDTAGHGQQMLSAAFNVPGQQYMNQAIMPADMFNAANGAFPANGGSGQYGSMADLLNAAPFSMPLGSNINHSASGGTAPGSFASTPASQTSATSAPAMSEKARGKQKAK
ncbi:uncharacterized protein STEHIDRAFT_160036 [Stereum hirsutum FP-91666 SS1]|uniref:uncharacterized protein n=1 Tax=Stereum hirsutum (strain FP-91666) TaxID=721885 RepID=UPI00044495C5|nr:uncharacterized protein STEHIDRAFT_160036 [Stereum hirsutum FP-91666 SS1]EIM83453.1 hypothetical protein STEHIDRAFT_160036 [Stereum hirsutum FP-91666 SS1]